MWYSDDLVERKEDDGGLADGDLLKKAGFTAAHKRLSSPSLANVNRCRCRYLELTDDVSRVFFGATSCGTSYYSCWVPIGKSVPDEGMIPRSVVEATIEAGGSHFFDRLMVVSYLRTIGVEGEKQKEWAVVGRASDNGKEHRFLIGAYLRQGGIAHYIALARTTHGHTTAHPYLSILRYSIGSNNLHKGHIHICRGFHFKEDSLPISNFQINFC